MIEQLDCCLGHQCIPVRLNAHDHGSERGRQDFLAFGRNSAFDPLANPSMTRQELVASLVREDRSEGEILWVRIALKRFRINDEQILRNRASSSKLGTPAVAVNMTVLDASDESQRACDSSDSLATATTL